MDYGEIIMNTSFQSSILLLGIGGSGCVIARKIKHSFGDALRVLTIDTDAVSGGFNDIPFILLGGNRLAGRGTGAQPAAARAAFQDSSSILDPHLQGVSMVVIVTGLGGGTGTGATSEILKHLHTLGITTLLFATTPYMVEGKERCDIANKASGPLEQYADVSVIIPLDDLVSGLVNVTLKQALECAVKTLAEGISLFWRVIETPGYIRLDSERLRQTLINSGRARFATVEADGEKRVDLILKKLDEYTLLRERKDSRPVKKILLGILAGDDLKLSEVGQLVNSIKAGFGPNAVCELGTVEDNETYSGRIAVTVLLFEEKVTSGAKSSLATKRAFAPNNRFTNSEKTFWNGEDLDSPTYLRRQLSLDR
jgi:cell division protein FtsZ